MHGVGKPSSRDLASLNGRMDRIWSSPDLGMRPYQPDAPARGDSLRPSLARRVSIHLASPVGRRPWTDPPPQPLRLTRLTTIRRKGRFSTGKVDSYDPKDPQADQRRSGPFGAHPRSFGPGEDGTRST